MAFPAHTRGRDPEKIPKGPRKKKSKWGGYAQLQFSSALAAIPRVIPTGLTIEQIETLLIRVRMEEIGRKINFNELDLHLVEERSPSPEPIYDKDGKRVNTRDQRAKDKLNAERATLVDVCQAMYPHFKPPADYTPGSSKKMRKILIPQEKYPDYNFIGLIIGPRGNTQKRMEKETGAKIAIRGKGSMKEGKANKNQGNDENEPLHVAITADTEIQLEKACKMVSELLIPMDESKNEHKQAQLRELAEINGTLRDRVWLAPTERSFEPAKVKCAICGEVSHPTSDCPLKGKTEAIMPGDKEAMDHEYEKFLTEIGEEIPPPPLAPIEKPKPEPDLTEQSISDAYEEFRAAISSEKAVMSSAPWQQPGYVPPPWSQTPAPWAQPQAPPPWMQPAGVVPGQVPPPWAAPYGTTQPQ